MPTAAASALPEWALPSPLALVVAVFLSAATAIPSSPAPLVADGVEVADELVVLAPPVAAPVDVAPVVPLPAPPVCWLEFVPDPPAPPAPPVSITEVVFVAELVCVIELEFVFVLLPEFVPVAAFEFVFVLPWFTSSANAVAANPSASTAIPARNVVCSFLT
jgi:hypothetical protein